MADKAAVKIDAHRLLDGLSRIVLRMLPLVPGPELYDLVKDLSKTRTDLDQKIGRAQASLIEASELIAELEKGLSERVTKLQRLKQEYDKYSQLAAVEEDKARAIIQQIEVAIGRNRGRERLIALGLNLLAGLIVFILGVALGPYLTRWLGFAGS
jgi:hypothetical protein